MEEKEADQLKLLVLASQKINFFHLFKDVKANNKEILIEQATCNYKIEKITENKKNSKHKISRG